MNRFLLLIFFIPFVAYPQEYKLESSEVSFFAEATVEDIAAKNSQVSGRYNSNTGDIELTIPMKEFTFRKSLMQKHFNEKYLHTEKYPYARFKGKLSRLDPKGNGDAVAKGKLTLHGVTRDVTIQGKLKESGNAIRLKGKFVLDFTKHDVSPPTFLWRNIAEEVEVTTELVFTSDN